MALLNSRAFNGLFRSFSKSKFSRHFIKAYVKKFKINIFELKKDLRSYESLNEFFTRQIDFTYRPLCLNKEKLVAPCDGFLSEQGEIDEKNNFQIKGKNYSIKELLKKEDIEKLRGGVFSLIYLSPSDYHRFHAITKCELIEQYSLGDKSEPVNDMGLAYGEPIVKNYRIIQKLKDEFKNEFYLIYIGAVNVNSIVIHEKKSYERAEEVGYFEFGSSIMLLFPKGMVKPYIEEKSKIKVRECLYEYIKS